MFVFDLTQDASSQEDRLPLKQKSMSQASSMSQSLFAQSTNSNIISLLESPSPLKTITAKQKAAMEVIRLDESSILLSQEGIHSQPEPLVPLEDCDGPFSEHFDRYPLTRETSEPNNLHDIISADNTNQTWEDDFEGNNKIIEEEDECSVSGGTDITHTNNPFSQTNQRFIFNPIPSTSCSDDVRPTGNTRGGKPMLSDIFDLLNEKENEINLSQPSRYAASSAPLKRASTMPPIGLPRQISSSSTLTTTTTSSSITTSQVRGQSAADPQNNEEDDVPDIVTAGRKRSVESTSSNTSLKRTKSKKIATSSSLSSSATTAQSLLSTTTTASVASSSTASFTPVSTSIVNDDSQMSRGGDTNHSRYERPLASLDLSYDYDVTLMIDSRERSSSLILGALITSHIPCELSTLAVGDFLWIAKPKGWKPPTQSKAPAPAPVNAFERMMQSSATVFASSSSASTAPRTPQTIEEVSVVLDCIVERKTMADMASSLIDGRYSDQKFRLKNTSLPVRCYIVEGEHVALPMQMKCISPQHVKTAMVTSHVSPLLSLYRYIISSLTIKYIYNRLIMRCTSFALGIWIIVL